MAQALSSGYANAVNAGKAATVAQAIAQASALVGPCLMPMYSLCQSLLCKTRLWQLPIVGVVVTWKILLLSCVLHTGCKVVGRSSDKLIPVCLHH